MACYTVYLETALPTTGMVIVYVISATFFGFLADKQIVDRRYVLCGAIIFWSLATACAGLAQNLEQLVVLRSLVGVGEAGNPL
jgi:MFS family permease